MSVAVDALQRQRLVRLTRAAWRRLAGRTWSAEVAGCIADWAAHDRPLVVARQRAPGVAGVLAGLPAPAAWGRRRIGLEIEPHDVASVADFPVLADVVDLLPRALRGRAIGIDEALGSAGARPRIYGSFGWQRLTGLDYLHGLSDLDLLVRVRDIAAADRVVTVLGYADAAFTAATTRLGCRISAADEGDDSAAGWGHKPAAPRIDGEIVFDDERAVAWREWAAWRGGRSRQVLVKTMSGASLESDRAWGGAGSARVARVFAQAGQ